MSFKEFLIRNKIDKANAPFTQLSYKVCAYGYFPKFKQNMKNKFKEYLYDSAKLCPDLNTLKIIFNGFQANNFINN